MTIQFNCPKCNELIAFDNKHIGKRAVCTNCGQKFIIPDENTKKVKQIKPPKEAPAIPKPGFYRALVLESWKLSYFHATPLVFIFILILVKFLASNSNFYITLPGALRIRLYIPLGYVLWASSWGLLFWYYRQIVYSTAFDENEMPDVVLGGEQSYYEFFWKILSSVYTIIVILFILELPYLIAAGIFRLTGIEQPVILQILMYAGLLPAPAAMLNIAVGQDFMLLRPDYLITPIFRAFLPYFTILLLVSIVIVIETFSSQYSKGMLSAATGRNFGLNILSQIILITTMRSIGLFYRHYNCVLPW